ncbi:MAG: glycosyltransferase family 4 protein [Anaerolineae bacterium]
MKRLLIVTDAWEPQTNGVVTTLQSVIPHLETYGYRTHVMHPGLFETWPLPSYPEIRVMRNPLAVAPLIRKIDPDVVHLATEGPLGLTARWLLRRWGMPFTTSLHTKFPEYVHQRIRLPLRTGYGFLRWFHGAASATLCTTESHRRELDGWGLRNLVVWGRGVDTQAFTPLPGEAEARAPHRRPRLLYVGRVAVEKNLDAFLSLPLDADMIVVGDGPARTHLQRRYPQATWLGYRRGRQLVEQYALADAFVFPSRTDTFGLVMLEAMACGTPVAAFPVTGPQDVVIEAVSGCLNEDLAIAVEGALRVDRSSCRAHARSFDWREIARTMARYLDHDRKPGPAGRATSGPGGPRPHHPSHVR